MAFAGMAMVWMIELGVSLAREVSWTHFALWVGVVAGALGGAWLIGLNSRRRWMIFAGGLAVGGVLRWLTGEDGYGQVIGLPCIILWMALLCVERRPKF
jgi:hypothetical protein